uniref:Cholesterol oxidase n=1 Tax=Fagus sylvatica TaxID=28930 RepID=A0A2N9IZP7_FAGSY
MKKEAELEGRVGDGEEDGYDAVVVGSGYGGSVAACRMPIAGIKVCLIEKGRRWEAQDFPTDSLKIMSTVRMKNQNLGIRFGPKDALFQVYGQNDSLAAVACGLGGGSLVNATANSMRPQRMDSCLACGNCLAGCPYNAKRCDVKTECQVQYVVKSPYDTCQEEGRNSRKRRWHVYLDEIDYITCDFVILSAGVFVTTENLFRSQMRGLKLSDALGSGFSCNGNTVAYLAGSPAPLNSFGLDRKQLSKIPFQERPGPSISSSYTIPTLMEEHSQCDIYSAVIPTAYPYGWPSGYWFFHGIIDKVRHIIGLKASQAIVLNAMGYDDSDGKIMLDKDMNRICFSPPHDPLLPKKIKTFQKLAKKLGGILYLSRYRSTLVHLLGGCNASSDPSYGVCNPNGQVFDPESSVMVHPGLYICDASLIPCSVGINPSLTIATAAEYVSRHLVQDVLKYKSVKTANQNPHAISNKNIRISWRSMVVFKETMRGYVGGMPCTAFLKMNMISQEQKCLSEWKSCISDCYPLLRGKVGGYVEFSAIEKDKLHVIDGKVSLCEVDYRTPYTQYMHYHLLLAASSGSRYILEGKKIINPYLFALYAWRETTTLHVTFKKIVENNSREDKVHLKGELRISMVELWRKE